LMQNRYSKAHLHEMLLDTQYTTLSGTLECNCAIERKMRLSVQSFRRANSAPCQADFKFATCLSALSKERFWLHRAT